MAERFGRKPLTAQLVIRVDAVTVERVERLRAHHEQRGGLPVLASAITRAALDAGLAVLEKRMQHEEAKGKGRR